MEDEQLRVIFQRKQKKDATNGGNKSVIKKLRGIDLFINALKGKKK